MTLHYSSRHHLEDSECVASGDVTDQLAVFEDIASISAVFGLPPGEDTAFESW